MQCSKMNNFLSSDHHVNQLQPHAKTMAQYLWSRKRPVEEADIRIRAKQLAEELGVSSEYYM